MKHTMKYILITLILLTFCSEAANVKSNSKKQTIAVDKKPMTSKQKQQVRKELQSGKKKCYTAYDKKTRKSHVLCSQEK